MAQLANLERPLGSVKDNFHWVNHLSNVRNFSN